MFCRYRRWEVVTSSAAHQTCTSSLRRANSAGGRSQRCSQAIMPIGLCTVPYQLWAVPHDTQLPVRPLGGDSATEGNIQRTVDEPAAVAMQRAIRMQYRAELPKVCTTIGVYYNTLTVVPLA